MFEDRQLGANLQRITIRQSIQKLSWSYFFSFILRNTNKQDNSQHFVLYRLTLSRTTIDMKYALKNEVTKRAQ